MNPSQAEALANRVVQQTDFSQAEQPERAQLVTRDALQWAVESYFPDKAPVAVVLRNDGWPLALALSDSTLQVLEPLLPASAISPGRVRWRAVGIVAGRDQITAETSYRRNSMQHERSAQWELVVGDLAFGLETIVDETEEKLPTDEVFAQAMARVLGAKIPQPMRTVRLRALS